MDGPFGQKVPVMVPAPLMVAAVAGEAVFAITIEPVEAHELKANPAVANACRATTVPTVMYIVPVGLIVPEPAGLTMKDTETCCTKSINWVVCCGTFMHALVFTAAY